MRGCVRVCMLLYALCMRACSRLYACLQALTCAFCMHFFICLYALCTRIRVRLCVILHAVVSVFACTYTRHALLHALVLARACFLHALHAHFRVHALCMRACFRLYALISALRVCLPSRWHALVCAFACVFACLALLRFCTLALACRQFACMLCGFGRACTHLACVFAGVFFSRLLVCVFAYAYTRLVAHALVCAVTYACMRVFHGIYRCFSVLPSCRFTLLSRIPKKRERKEGREEGE